jgi:transposase
MRGAVTFTESLVSIRRLDDFLPQNHPLRPVSQMVNEASKKIEPLLSSMYAADIKGGRPSIAPEKLLRSMLLHIFYSERSDRLLMEQTQYILLFRWFIGLSMDDSVWVPTVFTKNRERLISHDAVIELFSAVLAIAEQNQWLSGEHFSVDGTLIQAWARYKSFQVKRAKADSENDSDDSDGDKDHKEAQEPGNFKGQRRSNDTHESTTDADARLYRKGNTASELRFMGHTLSDNRHGLIANARLNAADGHVEREAVKVMIADAKSAAGDQAQITVGADKGYDAKEFVEALIQMDVAPHVAQNTSGRSSAVPDSVAATEGCAISQQKRKLIQQGFGWAKLIGPIRQVMVRGQDKDDHLFVLTMAVSNLTRMRTLRQIRPQVM